MSLRLGAAWLVAFGTAGLWAQPAHLPPAFDAAVIKPPALQNRIGISGGPGTSDPGQITCFNVTVGDIVQKAYGVRHYQIKGPAWLDSARFDILAKVAKGATREDLGSMFQDLLAERFKLILHRETKELPAYALVVNKGGPKLKRPANNEVASAGAVGTDERGFPVAPAGPLGRAVVAPHKSTMTLMVAGRIMIMGDAQPLTKLADALTNHLDRLVIDSTGLEGTYDFALDFAANTGMLPPSGAPGEGGWASASPGDGDSAPGAFSALKEQLGLKLEPRKAPVELLVIDHAEKTPTEN